MKLVAQRNRSREFAERRTTASERALPGLIVLGAQKAGTTSLHSFLGQHPDLIPPFRKEVHFFDGGKSPDSDDFAKGEEFYRSYFPERARMERGQLTFEASPLYLSNPLVPDRIAGLLPEVKLIAILRNPTDRAVSHYKHERQRGKEDLPLIDALRAEETRIGPALAKGDYKNLDYARKCYKHRGLYAEQLERYFAAVGRDRVLVLESDRFFAKPHETLTDVYNYIGVDDFHNPDVAPRNVATISVRPDAEAIAYLDEWFKPHNERLFDLLGERFDW